MSFTNPDYVDERTGNYFIDHWRGNLTLPVSYWINGSLVTALVAGLLFAINVQLNASSSSLRTVSAAAIVLALLGFGVWIWTAVGIWRSASKHAGRGGSAVWANIARGMIVLGALNYSAQLARSLPQLAEMGQIAAGRDPIGSKATLAVAGDALSVSGFISAGTAQAFDATLRAHPEVRRVLLKSPGGRIRDATQMAAAIAARQLDTLAVGDCASSCTIVFLAGTHRFAEVGSSLGFHSPSGTAMTNEEAQTVNPEMRAAYDKAGLPGWFIDKAMATPSNAMWRPTETELIQIGAINGFTADRVAHNNVSIADGINKGGARRMDDVTVLIGAKASGMQLTFVHKVERQMAPIPRNVMDTLGKGIRATACRNTVDRMLIANGASYTYEYQRTDGRVIGRYRLDECPAQGGNGT